MPIFVMWSRDIFAYMFKDSKLLALSYVCKLYHKYCQQLRSSAYEEMTLCELRKCIITAPRIDIGSSLNWVTMLTTDNIRFLIEFDGATHILYNNMTYYVVRNKIAKSYKTYNYKYFIGKKIMYFCGHLYFKK